MNSTTPLSSSEAISDVPQISEEQPELANIASEETKKTARNFTDLPVEIRLPILLDAATQTSMPWLRYFHACCNAAARTFPERLQSACPVHKYFGRTLDRFEVHRLIAENMAWVRRELQKVVDEVHGDCALARS